MTSATARAPLLVALLATSGAAHLGRPATFDAIVPRPLPGPARWWTWASGIAELAVAVAVAVPGTRRVGGAAAAGLFVAVFPANVQMAVDVVAAGGSVGARVAALARLPLQLPLVLWALRIRRAARPGYSCL